MKPVEILTKLNICVSQGEARRFVATGAVKINGSVVNDKDDVKPETITKVEVGKSIRFTKE